MLLAGSGCTIFFFVGNNILDAAFTVLAQWGFCGQCATLASFAIFYSAVFGLSVTMSFDWHRGLISALAFTSSLSTLPLMTSLDSERFPR